MKLYDTIKINDHSYYINDEQQDSCYLIIGNEYALLIDLGLFKEPLLPTIKSLTDKKVIVACTHGHFDHTGAMNEFNQIYLSYLDKEIYFDNARFNSDFPLINFNLIQDLKDHHIFDLGNIKIEAISLPGHTPGSMIFLDHDNKCIYCGDAIGSGCGVWMQLFHSLKIIDYLAGLNKTITYLIKQGVDLKWQFWGGHNQQASQSRISSFNQLDFDLMMDLQYLCLRLLNGEIIGIKNIAPTFDQHQAYYASYGKAEIIYQKDRLK